MPLEFDQIIGLRSLLNIGFVLLCIFGLFGLFGEMSKLLSRRPADFVGFGIRFGITAVAMMSIPLLSSAAAELAIRIAGAFFEGGKFDALSAAFKTALGAGCDDYDWYEVIPVAFSMQGILMGLGWFITGVALAAKFMVIDLAWPVIFAFEVYSGILTIPLSFSTNQDALRPYLRRVISVAIWPIIYAFVFILISSGLPKAVALAGSEGEEVIWGCEDFDISGSTELRDGLNQLPRNDAGVPVPDKPAAEDASGKEEIERMIHERMRRDTQFIKILGGMVLYLIVLLKIPSISGRLMGVPGAPGLTELIGTAVSARKGKL